MSWPGAAVFSVAAAISAGQGEQSRLQDLAWLQGCWAMTAGDRVVEEQWMAPRGGAMLGAGRTVERARLVEYEFLMIRQEGERLVYEARPSGQAAASFAARSVSERAVVFENLQHDFPQRVGYERDGTNLLAWIEGTRNGQQRRVEFPYHRTSCERR